MTNLKSNFVKAVFILGLGCFSLSNGQPERKKNQNPADPWLAVADNWALEILNELNKRTESKNILLPITTDGYDSTLSDRNDASESLDEYQDDNVPSENKLIADDGQEAAENSHDFSSYVKLLLQIFKQYKYIFNRSENEDDESGKSDKNSNNQDILKFDKQDFDVAKMLLKD